VRTLGSPLRRGVRPRSTGRGWRGGGTYPAVGLGLGLAA
jgi:hypothetical protein